MAASSVVALLALFGSLVLAAGCSVTNEGPETETAAEDSAAESAATGGDDGSDSDDADADADADADGSTSDDADSNVAGSDGADTDGADTDRADTEGADTDMPAADDSETDGSGIDDSRADGDDTTTENAPPPDPPRLPSLALELTQVGALEAPIAMATRAGSEKLYLAQQNGEIRVLDPPEGEANDDGNLLVDMSDETVAEGERGLLGIAFSPDGRRLYVSFTDLEGTSHVDEFTMSEASRTENVESRRRILTLAQPFGNHNGGDLHFGPDGYLYIGYGDGGAGGDPLGAGQDRQNLLGAILRIDPDIELGDETGNPDDRAGALPYDIPDDNPFVGQPDAADEIWISGVRNPWRFTFDDATGDLWIADVGQQKFEEITYLPASTGGGRGANLGWNEMEGANTFEGGTEPADHTPPLFEYSHGEGACSITGGIVYRGEKIPALNGFYLFGDYCGDWIGAVRVNAAGAVAEEGRIAGLAVEPSTLISFGEGPDGEAYVLAQSGELHRIDPAG